MKNYIQKLGPVAIASHLKNLTDILFRDVVKIYSEYEIEFEPRWFTMVNLLDEYKQLPITEIATHLNQTHPAVNQVANALEKNGLIKSSKDKNDNRKRLIKLSTKGQALVKEMQPLWENIEKAVVEFLDENQPDFLKTLEKLENSLQNKSMYERISQQIKDSKYRKIKIITFKEKDKEYFAKFNLEWLEKQFEVEESDYRILYNPKEEIIDKGGQILFAKVDEQIVGTIAIIKHENNKCEFTKMAVTQKFQGQQIGKRLLEEAIDVAKKMNCNKVFLLTSLKLQRAIDLYKKNGFSIIQENAHKEYNLKRPSILMEYIINNYEQ